MALPLSGTHKAIELVVIETEKLTLIMKGKVDYKKHILQGEDTFMHFSCDGVNVQSVEVYDARLGELVKYEGQLLYPIFFENGIYELVVFPKNKERLTFYHEFAALREAISPLSRSEILSGNLEFPNEVGLSAFEILEGQTCLLSVRLEIFPTKLDYKTDYQNLLKSVNEEVYNLAYHFVKRTYLQGSAEVKQDPSHAEFYRLVTEHFVAYMRALSQIERRPHHQLMTCHEEVRGDRLRKQDSRGRSYLRKNAHKMVDVANGIQIAGRTVMPPKGLLANKQHTTDTHENRYVKYTMERIVSKLDDLKRAIHKTLQKKEIDEDILQKINQMQGALRQKLHSPFWREIGELDRTIYSLVLQRGAGYREVCQLYITLSKSIVLRGELYKMAMKDIARLYEYWTFLQLGRILQKYCDIGETNLIEDSKDGLFVSLRKDKVTYREFFHRKTGEKIRLTYQYNAKAPTLAQSPDSMLSIEKMGKDYAYEYIFDAKYKLAVWKKRVGPQEEDINTMHRYRDAIVMERAGVYERRAFGAYVLFPWHDEDSYRQHALYESIEKVNIGGLPFLPNATTLVEEIIDALLNKSADELQQQGILPVGASDGERFVYEVREQETGAYLVADGENE